MSKEYELPFSKLSTVDGPTLTVEPGVVIIRYDYVPPDEQRHWVTIEFSRVLAFKYVDEPGCMTRPEIIADGLLEIEMSESAWLQELKESWEQYFIKGSELYEMYGRFDFRHYALWFAEEGSYEVVAESFEVHVD
jgi:hypothetical protein